MNTKPSYNTRLYIIYLIVLVTSLDEGVKSENNFTFCPNEWKYYEPTNKCFKYISSEQKREKIQDFCMTKSGLQGALWAKITTKNETKFICSLNVMRNTWLWAGAKDKDDDNVYRYERDNEPMDSALIEWDTNQPSGANDDCLLLHVNCKWHDTGCGYNNYFVCEYPDANSCKINNGECGQVCNPSGLRMNNCSCNVDYNMVNNTCVEKARACDIDNGGCSHKCHNNGNKVVCACEPGFRLINKTTCGTDEAAVEEGMSYIIIPIVLLVIISIVAGAAFFVLKPKKIKKSENSEYNIGKDSIAVSEVEEEPKHSDGNIRFIEDQDQDDFPKEGEEEEPQENNEVPRTSE